MPYAAIDLFCGVGGLTKGLEQAGINVVAGIDFEPSCQYAYEENNNSVFIQKDITDVTPSELQALYPANADIRILAGCAPCQPFQNIHKDIEKTAIRTKSGGSYTPLVNWLRKFALP